MPVPSVRARACARGELVGASPRVSDLGTSPAPGSHARDIDTQHCRTLKVRVCD